MEAAQAVAVRGRAAPARDWRPLRRLALVAMLPVAGVIALGTLGPPAIALAVCDLLVDLVGASGSAASYDRVQSAANVAMFVPLGALLALGTRPSRWPLAILVGPALSLAAEWAQHRIPGRVPDGVDVLTNTAGGVLGFVAGGAVVGAVALASALLALLRRPAAAG